MVNTQLTFHMENYTETVGRELETGNHLVVLAICTHTCKKRNRLDKKNTQTAKKT